MIWKKASNQHLSFEKLEIAGKGTDFFLIFCHQLRHTMVTQLLNGGADIVAIQELLGHSQIELTMRYSRLSSLKAQHDYYQAMDRIMEKGGQAPSTDVLPIKN